MKSAVLLAALALGASAGCSGAAPTAPAAKSGASTAPEEAAFLRYIDGPMKGHPAGIPRPELVAAAHKWCDWLASGGSYDLALKPGTLQLPSYFDRSVLRDMGWAATHSMCPQEVLD